ncbi:hypothetical protein [Streptomyces sp. NPDC000983]|uniref:hypothetical protein n=1 Tax=Streptomyces sp. NPDC000983 TaxID=3154373 RepID=UPI0033220616
MRYLADAYIMGALRRGRPVEQFLGPIGAPGRRGVAYVEVRSTKASYGVYLHALEDVGGENLCDLVKFPPLSDGEDEEFGRLVATTKEPATALACAEEATGAARWRWVNENLVHDEYSDFVRAARPADRSPDGHTRPTSAADFEMPPR